MPNRFSTANIYFNVSQNATCHNRKTSTTTVSYYNHIATFYLDKHSSLVTDHQISIKSGNGKLNEKLSKFIEQKNLQYSKAP